MKYSFYIVFFLSVQLISAQESKTLNSWEFQKQDFGGIWEVWRTFKTEENYWENVELPHCFNAFDAVNPDVRYYQGKAWYRQMVKIENPYKNGRTIIHFEGAGQKTTLWIFDRKVGTHTGGYDEFSFDITDFVAELKKDERFRNEWNEKIPVAVCTDNSRDLEMIPSDLSDFFIYGGLYRKVHLEYFPEISVEQVHITPQLSRNKKSADIAIEIKLRNPLKQDETLDAKINIISPDGEKVAELSAQVHSLDSSKNLNVTIKSPQLWSPGSPLLYSCNLTLFNGKEQITVSETFGIRSFYFAEKGPFYLNGERLLLKGMHRHEDHAGVGAAMTDTQIRQEMQMIKDLGANFIRLGHYQQSELVLHLCDSLGLLVWEEIPWCRGGIGGKAYQKQAKDMLTAMINQHYNHPSVILWGLGNENDWRGDFETFETDKIRAFMEELNVIAHQMDSTRKTAIRRCGFCADVVDVYSPSIWAGWYRGKYTDYKNVSEEERKKVSHFFHAEWGASQHPFRYSNDADENLDKITSSTSADERDGDFLLTGGETRVSKDGTWSESYACNLIDWHLKEQLTMDSLTGSAYWTFKDFGTPLRPGNPIPYINQKGVVQRDFTPKESYYVFQSYWAEKPMVHIFGHTWTLRYADTGEKQLVKIYSNCNEVELYINGISQGKKKRNPEDFPAAGLRWRVPFSEGKNEIKAIGFMGKEQFEDTLLITVQTKKWGNPASFKMELVDDKADTCLVKIQAVDKDETPCLDAMNQVRFGISGDGELIDNLGTIKNSRVVQLSNGAAFIQVKKNAGQSVVSVKSGGLPTAFISLKSTVK